MSTTHQEQAVTRELAAIVAGSPPPSRVYRELLDAPLIKLLTSQGSGNIGLTGKACALCVGEGGPDLREEFLAYYAASTRTFWGDEEGTTIYGPEHLLSNAAVHWWATRGGDRELAEAALAWLRFWVGYYRLCRTSAGGYLTVGARSGGHSQLYVGHVAGPEGSPLPIPDAAWIGYLAAMAEGEDLGPRAALCKALGLGPGQSWIPRAALPLRGSLRAAAADPRPMPAFGLLSPVHVLRDGAAAVVAWMEEDVNSNTTPTLGVKFTGGVYRYLPVAGGPHLRERASGATCALEGGELVFRSRLPGYELQRLSVPGGLEEVILGVSGAAAPTPPAPPPLEKSPLAVVADQVEGLTVAGHDIGKRAIVLSDLHRLPAPPASRLQRLANLVEELAVPTEQLAQRAAAAAALRALAT
jgi:hypothetical protein